MKKEILYIGGIVISLGAIFFILNQYKKNKEGSSSTDDKDVIDLLKKIDEAKK